MKLFAADGDDGKTPKLRFGVVSDVHITVAHNVETWEKTIQWFKEQDVDAVLVAGDIADRGLLSELKDFSDSWYKIFPDDKGLNGKHVEKIFVCGNHDVEGFRYGKWKQRSKEDQDKIFQKTVIKDLPAAWDLCFHEEFKPIYAKQVKGYTFISSTRSTSSRATRTTAHGAGGTTTASPPAPYRPSRTPSPSRAIRTIR